MDGQQMKGRRKEGHPPAGLIPADSFICPFFLCFTRSSCLNSLYLSLPLITISLLTPARQALLPFFFSWRSCKLKETSLITDDKHSLTHSQCAEDVKKEEEEEDFFCLFDWGTDFILETNTNSLFLHFQLSHSCIMFQSWAVQLTHWSFNPKANKVSKAVWLPLPQCLILH